MKIKNTLQILSALLLFVSCGSGTARYEKTIAGAVQAKGGKIHNLNFKVRKLSPLSAITVADSIRYLREEFESQKEKDIAFATETLKAYEMIAGIGYNAETNLRIAGHRSRIDSLRNAPFVTPHRYAAMDGGSVLAQVVRCTYTIDIPTATGKVTAEETFDFFLSPDGGKCFGKSRAH